MDVALPKETFDHITLYLSKCPFGEVENLINELRMNVKAVTLTEPTQKGADVIVQSTQAQSEPEAPVEQTGGEETNNEEAKPSE